MSESYFAKLANEILDASEKLTNRFEEGLNILLGELDNSKSSSGGGGDIPSPEGNNADNEFEGWNDEEEMDDPSPLVGIAESVMGDIMASQVCMLKYMFVCCAHREKTNKARNGHLWPFPHQRI